MTEQILTKNLINVIEKHLNPTTIYLVGSHATKTYQAGSQTMH